MLAIIAAIESARAETGIEAFISVSAKRHLRDGVAAAQSLLDACESFQKKHLDKAMFITGLDMAGNEDNKYGAIPEHFSAVFERASRPRSKGGLGLECSCHAGEHTGASDIWSALKLPGIRQISHGLSAVDNSILMQKLSRSDILIDQLLISNAMLQAKRLGHLVDPLAVSELHPMPILVENGCPVALGSDDPGIQGTSIADEYLAAAKMGLPVTDLLACTANAIRFGFMPSHVKERLLKQVEIYSKEPHLKLAPEFLGLPKRAVSYINLVHEAPRPQPLI